MVGSKVSSRRKSATMKGKDHTTSPPADTTEAGLNIAETVDRLCTSLGRLNGELVTAITLRRISPRRLVEQVEQVKQSLTELETLLSKLGKGA